MSPDYCIYTVTTQQSPQLPLGLNQAIGVSGGYTELCFLPMISPDKKEYGNFHRQGNGIHTNQRTTFIRLTENIVAEFLKGLYAKTTYTNFLLY